MNPVPNGTRRFCISSLMNAKQTERLKLLIFMLVATLDNCGHKDLDNSSVKGWTSQSEILTINSHLFPERRNIIDPILDSLSVTYRCNKQSLYNKYVGPDTDNTRIHILCNADSWSFVLWLQRAFRRRWSVLHKLLILCSLVNDRVLRSFLLKFTQEKISKQHHDNTLHTELSFARSYHLARCLAWHCKSDSWQGVHINKGRELHSCSFGTNSITSLYFD
jgi:hypothetical protein